MLEAGRRWSSRGSRKAEGVTPWEGRARLMGAVDDPADVLSVHS